MAEKQGVFYSTVAGWAAAALGAERTIAMLKVAQVGIRHLRMPQPPVEPPPAKRRTRASRHGRRA